MMLRLTPCGSGRDLPHRPSAPVLADRDHGADCAPDADAAARHAVRLLAGLAISVAATQAAAQLYTAESATHVLRVNAIVSDQLPERTAQAHGIEPAPDRGVLNAVVLRKSDGAEHTAVTVASDVQALRQNLLGQREVIEMRPVVADERVSYLGTFSFAPLRNFRFMVTAAPRDGGETLRVEFDDRFVAR
jgi:hypothetical protein